MTGNLSAHAYNALVTDEVFKQPAGHDGDVQTNDTEEEFARDLDDVLRVVR